MKLNMAIRQRCIRYRESSNNKKNILR